jgi:ABC-type uncharacterized transport system substrate-binding protein
LTELPVRDGAEIERAVETIAAKANGGLVILPGPAPSVSRELVIALANKHGLPAVYPFRYWVTGGGLAFYGIDNIELHRQAARYVDRILKGEKLRDLPIQNATKFELVINLKAAQALGISPSNALLARTDEASVRRLHQGQQPPGLREQAGHMTASAFCAAREVISCQAGAIHT